MRYSLIKFNKITDIYFHHENVFALRGHWNTCKFNPQFILTIFIINLGGAGLNIQINIIY